MLSYRHSFHAGNFADVLKHCVCVHIFEHFLKKDKPFDYIDTHSGAGLFDLMGADATKLQEYTGGIHRIQDSPLPQLATYLTLVRSFNKPNKNIKTYPGSPAIATYYLRPRDKAHLHELHPQDAKFLERNIRELKKNSGQGVSRHNSIQVNIKDGLRNLQALVPPLSRRAFVLVDPSYEVKAEYDDVFFSIEKAYKKFPTGTYVIWYPVVDRSRIERLERKLFTSTINNIQRFELGVSADSDEKGMTSAGLFVINPPWTLFDSMSELLPRLAPLFSVIPDTNKELLPNSSKINNVTRSYYKCDRIKSEN